LVKKLDEASLARGRILYQENCLSCHGESGKGDGPDAQNQKYPPANLQKMVREVKDFTFFMSISQWQGDMPGWKEPFNDIEREDLVNYIKSFR
jgi:mono/diheme cytochrome c family protein